jgi:hypothetical protein
MGAMLPRSVGSRRTATAAANYHSNASQKRLVTNCKPYLYGHLGQSTSTIETSPVSFASTTSPCERVDQPSAGVFHDTRRLAVSLAIDFAANACEHDTKTRIAQIMDTIDYSRFR